METELLEETEVVETLPKAPKLIIPITQDIIDCAVKANSSHCVIADAIKKKYPKYTRVEVDIQTIRMTDKEKGVRYFYLTPPKAQKIIVSFDQGYKLDPFTLDIDSSVAQVRKIHSTSDKVKEMKRKSNEKRKLKFNDNEFHSTSSPTIEGGKPPPKVPNGQRRVFGMRNFAA